MARGFMSGGGAGGVDCDGCTAKAADIRLGKTAGIDGHDDRVAGTMPESYGGTITPTAYEQRFSGERYLMSDIVVPGFAMPAAAIIQRGVYATIYNQTVVGTYEGFHVGDRWIYNHGNIPADNMNLLVHNGVNSGGSIVANGSLIKITFTRTFTGWNQLIVKGSGFSEGRARLILPVGSGVSIEPKDYNANAFVIPVNTLNQHGYWPCTLNIPCDAFNTYLDEIYLE